MSKGTGHAAAPGSRLVFGSAAEGYERYRPGYPHDLIDAVLGYSTSPPQTALEVGAGTGKATRLFAARGVKVVALEPDPEMLGVLRRSTRYLPVDAVLATLEEYQTERAFDLVFAAAAWHWTDPETRWARAVRLLMPGGVLALFGVPGELKDAGLQQIVDDLERDLLPLESQTPGYPWSLDDLRGADGLTDVVRLEFPRAIRNRAEDFVGRLATVSAYLRLDAVKRDEALRTVRSALPDYVEIDASAHLVLARRE